MKKRIIVGIVLVVAATGVLAQDKLFERRLEAGFVMFDRDKDDALSETEFKDLGEYSPKLKGKPQIVERLFKALDSNHDGILSRSEYRKITTAGNGKAPLEESSTSETTTSETNAVANLNETLSDESVAFFERKFAQFLSIDAIPAMPNPPKRLPADLCSIRVKASDAAVLAAPELSPAISTRV